MNFQKSNLEVGSEFLQVKQEVRAEMPQWLSRHLDQHDQKLHEEIQLHLSDNHLNEELFDKLRYDISAQAHKELPPHLQAQLESPLPAEIPDGAQRYFGIFSAKVRNQIDALDASEVVSSHLQQHLNAKPALPSNYFEGLSNQIQAKVQDLQTETPAWLDTALQSVAFVSPPVNYFASFSGQVLETVHELEELASIEREEPTTIERLIHSPDGFTQLLDLAEQPQLPVGQELYFEDFSARVRQKVRGRRLDAQETVKPVRILHPVMKWSVAACFAVVTVTGTTWLLPSSWKQSIGITPKTEKVQVEIQGKRVELNLPKQEMAKINQLFPNAKIVKK